MEAYEKSALAGKGVEREQGPEHLSDVEEQLFVEDRFSSSLFTTREKRNLFIMGITVAVRYFCCS